MQKVEAITKTADEKAVTPCGALGFQVSAFYRSPAVHGHPSVPWPTRTRLRHCAVGASIHCIILLIYSMVCVCRQSSHHLPTQIEVRLGPTESIIKTKFTGRDLEVVGWLLVVFLWGHFFFFILGAYSEKLKSRKRF